MNVLQRNSGQARTEVSPSATLFSKRTEAGEFRMNRHSFQTACSVVAQILSPRLMCAAGSVLLLSFAAASATAQSNSANDEDYSKKIKEYTTEPFFLTNLVDHLPASATVPTPEKVLGHIIGAPDVLTYSKDIYRYYDELAKASPRVKVFRVGQSEEGRDFLLVAVSDEANIAQLDQLKQITARL